MKIIGKPDKDLNEVMKHIYNVMQKRIDEAYQEGLNDGKEYGLNEANVREAVFYQKGLTDAWAAAKKIAVLPSYGGIDGRVMMAVFGTVDISEVFNKFCPSEVIAKLKTYEEQKNDNEIKVGDEVKSLDDSGEEIKGFLPWIITIVDEDDDYCQGIDKEGRVHATQKVRACKTGRHFDIASILEAMRHD